MGIVYLRDLFGEGCRFRIWHRRKWRTGYSMNDIKLGFLAIEDETENQSQMLNGVFEAAEKYDAHVIRFAATEYPGNPDKFQSELQNLIHIIETQDLDGLLFLGWLPGLCGKQLDDFLAKFSRMPLVCLGAKHSRVPSVYADPRKCLTELMDHLIHDHGCRNIVFVSPDEPDERNSIYAEEMKRYGLYREELEILPADFDGIASEDRIPRLLDILLKERRIDVDAILIMTDKDAQILLPELQRRKIRVPADIAVVSFEDSEYANYSLPPLTTVTYPWRQVGYQGCEKIIRLLSSEAVMPAKAIPSRLNIRNSCGCNSSKVKDAKIERKWLHEYAHPAVNRCFDFVTAIGSDLKAGFPYTPLHFDSLLAALEEDFYKGTTFHFPDEFERQLLEIVMRYPSWGGIDETDEILFLLRNLISPFLADGGEARRQFEDILFKSMLIIKEKSVAITGYAKIEMMNINTGLLSVSKSLIATFNIHELMNVLEANLHTLQIPSCYIFMACADNPEEYSLIFQYADSVRGPQARQRTGLQNITKSIMEKHAYLLCQMLTVEDDTFGFIVFEPHLYDARIYQTLALDISSALKSALLTEKLTEEISLREEKEKQLMHNANYDSLTDLFNRRYFIKALTYLVDHASRHPDEDNRFYLVYIDFDNFKEVNDSFGHDIGDMLIVEISNQFKKLFRRFSYHIPAELKDSSDGMSEAIFRLGGDEFTAIVTGISTHEIETLAEELVKTVSSHYLIEGHLIHISCSIGISIYPDHADSADVLIKYADTAMYRAKTRKDSFLFYEPAEAKDRSKTR